MQSKQFRPLKALSCYFKWNHILQQLRRSYSLLSVFKSNDALNELEIKFKRLIIFLGLCNGLEVLILMALIKLPIVTPHNGRIFNCELMERNVVE